MVFRGGRLKLTAERWADLARLTIRSIPGFGHKANLRGARRREVAVASPASGDCNDYAVIKRHELIARGWPARAVLLSEVVTNWGEHHLVVVVRTFSGR